MRCKAFLRATSCDKAVVTGLLIYINYSTGTTMKSVFFKATVTSLLICAAALPAFAEQGTKIPRSMAGDKGKYYLLESKRTGDIVKTLHKRVGVDSVGYTKTAINCKTMLIQQIGYSEESPAKIKEQPTEWYELVAGSSKSDLANFVCKR